MWCVQETGGVGVRLESRSGDTFRKWSLVFNSGDGNEKDGETSCSQNVTFFIFTYIQQMLIEWLPVISMF